MKRQTGRTANQGMDIPSSTNDLVQRPVIYKIVEKDAGYQELGALSLSGYQDLMNRGMEDPSFTTPYDLHENRGGCLLSGAW